MKEQLTNTLRDLNEIECRVVALLLKKELTTLPVDQDFSVCNRLERFEGSVPHMYLDSLGNVTIGIGHLLPKEGAVINLTMQHKTTHEIASSYDKRKEFNKINALPKGYKTNFYASHTNLYISQANIILLTLDHIKTFREELTNLYKDFDYFPTPAQEALFDMIFNLGATRLSKGFPKFNRAVRDKDWGKAAEECGRRDVQTERNDEIKRLLQEAM
jgi:GH24 family phage-related lysozyme (muramidase)